MTFYRKVAAIADFVFGIEYKKDELDKDVVNIDSNKRTLQDSESRYDKFANNFDIARSEIDNHDSLSPGARKQVLSLASMGNRRLPGDCARANKRHLVLSFISTVMVCSEWYTNKLNKSWGHKYGYLLLSLGIAAGTPGAVFLLQLWIANDGTPAAGWTTGLSALLTGLIGLQKVSGSWFDSHRRYGALWKARSGLLDILYTLESKWRGRAMVLDDQGAPTIVFDDAFIAALEDGTAQARVIIRAEQQSFFDTYSAPTPDPFSAITGAQSAASSLMTQFAPPVTTATADVASSSKATYAVKAQLDQVRAAIQAIPLTPTGTVVNAADDATLKSLQNKLAELTTSYALAQGTEQAARMALTRLA